MELDGLWSQVRLWREAQLDDELECTKWCIRAGLMHQSSCRRHRRDRVLRFREDRGYAYWTCTTCKDQKGVASGTIFEDANLPFGRALMLAQCYANETTYEAARLACVFSESDTPLSDDTISHWFGMFRDRLVDSVEDWNLGSGPIGGPGVIVQVDEAQIMRRKYSKGRVKPGTWVCGLIDASGHLRMEICEKRDKATLHEIIHKHVHVGSIVHTDGWASYKGLDKLGYEHRDVNHKEEFVADDGTHTQLIENTWRQMRRRLSRGGVPHGQLPQYMVEFMWHRMCRRANKDRFVTLQC